MKSSITKSDGAMNLKKVLCGIARSRRRFEGFRAAWMSGEGPRGLSPGRRQLRKPASRAAVL